MSEKLCDHEGEHICGRPDHYHVNGYADGCPTCECDGKHPAVGPGGVLVNMYDLVTHWGCPHQPWAPARHE